MQRVGDDHEDLRERPEYYITSGGEQKQKETREDGLKTTTKRTSLYVLALHQTAQGWEVEKKPEAMPDSQK